MSLHDYYQHCAIKKPEPRVKTKAREDRKEGKSAKDVRAYIFGRERNLCRCCRLRPAESMHEIKFKSAGGKVSRKNSIAVCGRVVGTEVCCHTYLQQKQITVGYGILGAEGELIFTPENAKAAEWLKVKVGEQIESKVMLEMEAAE